MRRLVSGHPIGRCYYCTDFRCYGPAQANPEPGPTSARWGSRCPICLEEWDMNAGLRVALCCCRRVCVSCDRKISKNDRCPLCRSPPLVNEAAELAALRRHVENGCPEATNLLGTMYRNGLLGLEVNKRKAVKIFKRAVERGDVFAMSNLGVMYEKGIGVKVDREVGFKKAEQLYRMAADRGCYGGRHNLGLMMRMKGDYDKAMFHLDLSAKQGYPPAAHDFERAKLAPRPPTDVKLRFGLGARVECAMENGPAEGKWVPGTIVALWYHEEEMPAGFIAPYQIELDDDDGTLIFSSNDNTSIRVESAQLRFALGDHVECCVMGMWHPGTVIGQRVARQVPGYPFLQEVAYKVLRFDGEVYYAPEDDDQYIQRSGALDGVPLPPSVGPRP